jgi:hypothetical protein
VTRKIPPVTAKYNGGVRVVETGDEYENVQSLCRHMGLYYPHVYSYLRGSRNTPVEGYTFEYLFPKASKWKKDSR